MEKLNITNTTGDETLDTLPEAFQPGERMTTKQVAGQPGIGKEFPTSEDVDAVPPKTPLQKLQEKLREVLGL